ncbi:MAG: hypothetical protein GXP41_00225 [Chloroflexi bacterium]|nr:hypothetical protein [Chloroflexota bacterium]
MNSKNDSSPLVGCFRTVWTLGKFTVVILLGIVAGVGIFTAGQYAYWGLWSPISSNTQAIHQLQETGTQTQKDIGDLQLQVRTLSKEVTDLTSQRETQLQRLQKRQEEQRSRLKTIEEQLATIQDQTARAQKKLVVQEQALEILTNRSISNTATISQVQILAEVAHASIQVLSEEISATQTALAGPQAAVVNLEMRLLLLQAANQTLQARLYLSRSNVEAAGRDLELVDTTLQQALAVAPQEWHAAIVSLQERVATAKQELTDNPLAVPEEVDLLWKAISTLVNSSPVSGR